MASMTVLDKHTDALAEHTASVAREASSVISAKIDDTRAHVVTALTESLRGEQDGRRTIAKARQSRSYAAAQARLRELTTALLEIDAESREKAYRDSITWWSGQIPQEYLISSDPVPTIRNLRIVRSAAIHGYLPSTRINDPIKRISQSMLAVLSQSASRAVAGRDATDLIRAWAARSADTLTSIVVGLIGDGVIFADRKAGRDVVRRELLHDDPTMPE